MEKHDKPEKIKAIIRHIKEYSFQSFFFSVQFRHNITMKTFLNTTNFNSNFTAEDGALLG